MAVEVHPAKAVRQTPYQRQEAAAAAANDTRKATKKQFIHEATEVALAMNGEVHTQTKEIHEPSVCTT